MSPLTLNYGLLAVILLLINGGQAKGPAYDSGVASCPGGGRVVHLVNNCPDSRWFKFDGRTTPQFARPSCPYSNIDCVLTPGTDPMGIVDCYNKIRQNFNNLDAGVVYCVSGKCNCNPDYQVASGRDMKINFPSGQDWTSGTGWLADGCNQLGGGCTVGNSAARNSLFEFTYTNGQVWYDMSAVDAWTTISPVGLRVCGSHSNQPNNPFWCAAVGCDFNVHTQCPDGSGGFSAGPGPDGGTANNIPTGTVFNANNVGGQEWVWQGPADFAQHFGSDQGSHANRRFQCDATGCRRTDESSVNTCLSGCDYCTTVLGKAPDSNECIKYCCPDIWVRYSGYPYQYDSAGCRALGVQQGTDFTATLNAYCKHVYTYAYEDRTSTFQCDDTVTMQIMACPDTADFPTSG
uniref:Uncharacterized protein n=1 Tax=Plectus sambesii TaxID=2011161 RepID=A0A914VT08_9BILA